MSNLARHYYIPINSQHHLTLDYSQRVYTTVTTRVSFFISYQVAQHVVRHVARGVAERPGGAVREDDGRARHGQGVAHRAHRDV